MPRPPSAPKCPVYGTDDNREIIIFSWPTRPPADNPGPLGHDGPIRLSFGFAHCARLEVFQDSGENDGPSDKP